MDLDTVVERLNQKWGRFHLLTFSLLCLPFVSHATFYMSYVFTAVTSTDMRCSVPECEANDSNSDWLQFAVPFANGLPDPCLRFTPIPPEQPGQPESQCLPEHFSNSTEKCERRVFSNPDLSILTEWDLACSSTSEWSAGLVGLANNLGRLLGQPVSGYVSDHFGRRSVVLAGLSGSVAVGLIRSFSPSYGFFVAFEFLDPIFHDGLSAAAFLLGMEQMPASMRGPWSAVAHIVFPLGLAYLGCVAWLLPSWRWQLRVMACSACLTLPALWTLPESYRWLVSRGRVEDAVKAIKQAARMNRVPPEQLKLDGVKMHIPDAQRSAGEKGVPGDDNAFSRELLQLLRSRVLVCRLLNCCLCWIVNMLVYDGLSVNSVSSMAGDRYLNFILVVLVEVPGGLLAWFCMRLTGRRPLLGGSLISTAVCCIAYHFLPDGWPRVAAVLGGKLSITVSFSVVYVVSAELFPTRVRHTLCALSSTVGRLGTLLAPQTRLLTRYLDSLPFLLFGGAALLSGLASLALPETSVARLPDSVREAEQLGRKSTSPLDKDTSERV